MEALIDLNDKNELHNSSCWAKATQVERIANVDIGRSNRECHGMKRGNNLARVIKRYHRLGDES